MFRRFYLAPIPRLFLRNPPAAADACHISKKVHRFDGVLPNNSSIHLVSGRGSLAVYAWMN